MNSPGRKKQSAHSGQGPAGPEVGTGTGTGAGTGTGEGGESARSRLEKAAAAAAAASMQQRMSDRHSDRDRDRYDSESPQPTHRQHRHRDTHQSSSSARRPPDSPPHMPQVYPALLDELGMRPKSSEGRSAYQDVGRRAATPGGSLESESHVVAVGPGSESRRSGWTGGGAHQQSRSRLHTIDEDSSRKYRKNVDDDDLFVVDWQHNYGFPTKRGTTPGDKGGGRDRSSFEEPSFVSDSRLVDPNYGPNGLLAELSVQRLPPEPQFIRRRRGVEGGAEGQLSMTERSLTSESLLMYAGNRTPNRSAPSSRNGQRAIATTYNEVGTITLDVRTV
jgi:hypothetical protein